jgi:hypothetical protein
MDSLYKKPVFWLSGSSLTLESAAQDANACKKKRQKTGLLLRLATQS